jgi:hypothetical protein
MKKLNLIYSLLSVVLIAISLVGAVYLVRTEQDIRDHAAPACSCYPDDEDVCKGEWFNPCTGVTCQGTKDCKEDG